MILVISAINIFFSLCAGFIFADEQNPPLPSETNAAGQEDAGLSEFQKQARIYRLEGLKLQKLGNLEEALGLFQKAIGTDPSLVTAYNDVGIIYESLGSPQMAEEAYQKVIMLMPGFTGSYSNLALLYESQNQMDRAVFYWANRAELGPSDDPWRMKAKNRYDQLMESMPEIRNKQVEFEASELMNKVSSEKRITKLQIQKYLDLSRQLFHQGDYISSLQELEKVLEIEPENNDVWKIKQELMPLARKQKDRDEIEKLRSAFNQGQKGE